MTRPIEDLQAGAAFRDSMIPRADVDKAGAPLWYGWVIMYAFLAGVDHARAALPPAGWRDISTAPKDGTRILAFQHPFEAYIAYRHDPGGEDRNPKHHYECWAFDTANVKAYPCKPTHWMPLPPAPQLRGE